MGVTLVEQWGPTPDWSDSKGGLGSRDRFLLFQGIVLARESPHVQLLLEHLMSHLKSSCGPHGLEIHP